MRQREQGEVDAVIQAEHDDNEWRMAGEGPRDLFPRHVLLRELAFRLLKLAPNLVFALLALLLHFAALLLLLLQSRRQLLLGSQHVLSLLQRIIHLRGKLENIT